MGRKVHPVGFRLGINQPWGGRWFDEGGQYREQLHQDFAMLDEFGCCPKCYYS